MCEINACAASALAQDHVLLCATNHIVFMYVLGLLFYY